jgi:hypothetical protein
MKLVIRSAGVWGHPNIRTWEPGDPAVVAELLMVEIGPSHGRAADSFTLRLATPAGLDRLTARDGILATRPLLVMRRYDFDDLWRWLERTVQSCAADSWSASVEKLCRYFDWEYQGYAEH